MVQIEKKMNLGCEFFNKSLKDRINFNFNWKGIEKWDDTYLSNNYK